MEPGAAELGKEAEQPRLDEGDGGEVIPLPPLDGRARRSTVCGGGRRSTFSRTLTGWLEKRARFTRAWRRRHCRLGADGVLSWAVEDGGTPRGAASVAGAAVMLLHEGGRLQGAEPEHSEAELESPSREIAERGEAGESSDEGEGGSPGAAAGAAGRGTRMLVVHLRSGRRLELRSESHVSTLLWANALEKAAAAEDEDDVDCAVAHSHGDEAAARLASASVASSSGTGAPAEQELPPSRGARVRTRSVPLFEGISAATCVGWLCSQGPNEAALKDAMVLCRRWNETYRMGTQELPLDVRLQAWRSTVQHMARALTERIDRDNADLADSVAAAGVDGAWQLAVATESFILQLLHDKLFKHVAELYRDKDERLLQAAELLEARGEAAVFEAVGVRPQFKSMQLGAATETLLRLPNAATPAEKADVLREAAMALTESAQRRGSVGSEAEDEELPCTDDLLGFITALVARARVPGLFAHLAYIEHFLGCDFPDAFKGELGFHHTNFTVACEYLLGQSGQPKR